VQGEIIKKLQSHFDALAQRIPGEEIEFWFARDLQEPLGHS
jgi:DNA-damage-inducible protein D